MYHNSNANPSKLFDPKLTEAVNKNKVTSDLGGLVTNYSLSMWDIGL